MLPQTVTAAEQTFFFRKLAALFPVLGWGKESSTSANDLSNRGEGVRHDQATPDQKNKNENKDNLPDEKSPDGNSPAEKVTSKLVKPGEIQADQRVPGEDDVVTDASEIYIYATALALQNGFHNLTEDENNKRDLRDPNLVFPGDELNLPDQRRVKVEPQETIWKIATFHYKRDYARIEILIKQAKALIQKNGKKLNREKREEIENTFRSMQRLAVTPGMQNMIDTARKEVLATP